MTDDQIKTLHDEELESRAKGYAHDKWEPYTHDQRRWAQEDYIAGARAEREQIYKKFKSIDQASLKEKNWVEELRAICKQEIK